MIQQVDIPAVLENIKQIRTEESIERKLNERRLIETLPVGAGGFRGMAFEAFQDEAAEDLSKFLDSLSQMSPGDLIDFKIVTDPADGSDYRRLSTFELTCIKRERPKSMPKSQCSLCHEDIFFNGNVWLHCGLSNHLATPYDQPQSKKSEQAEESNGNDDL
jgi:hypothetical protein